MDKMNNRNGITIQRSEKILPFTNLLMICLIIICTATILVILYKILISPIDFSKFDFSDFLSLILAFFSIGLSIMFYFKTNETANLFYDNTYKFTGHVSEILGRMETGFGTQLKHIQENYSRIAEISSLPKKETEKEKKIEETEAKKQKEMQEFILSLVDQMNLQEKQKQEILSKYHGLEQELEKVRRELFDIRHSTASPEIIEDRIIRYLLKRLDRVKIQSKTELIFHFLQILSNEDQRFYTDLEKIRWLKKGTLTPYGNGRLIELFEKARNVKLEEK